MPDDGFRVLATNCVSFSWCTFQPEAIPNCRCFAGSLLRHLRKAIMTWYHTFDNLLSVTMGGVDFLTELNPQQQQAVTAGLGPVLVLAGPGSGKTRVLTQRIAYLIGSWACAPTRSWRSPSPTRPPARWKAGCSTCWASAPRGVSLGTFHAICARILRREAEHLPFDSNFVIFDDDDQISLVKRADRRPEPGREDLPPAGHSRLHLQRQERADPAG